VGVWEGRVGFSWWRFTPALTLLPLTSDLPVASSPTTVVTSPCSTVTHGKASSYSQSVSLSLPPLISPHLFPPLQEEGAVLKALRSPYQPGSRNGSWLKLKPDYLGGAGEWDAVVLGQLYDHTKSHTSVGGVYLLGLPLHPPPSPTPADTRQQQQQQQSDPTSTTTTTYVTFAV
ncbi:hypothetical protein Agub_g11788, partial [Astrephomene gubernaculifera]